MVPSKYFHREEMCETGYILGTCVTIISCYISDENALEYVKSKIKYHNASLPILLSRIGKDTQPIDEIAGFCLVNPYSHRILGSMPPMIRARYWINVYRTSEDSSVDILSRLDPTVLEYLCDANMDTEGFEYVLRHFSRLRILVIPCSIHLGRVQLPDRQHIPPVRELNMDRMTDTESLDVVSLFSSTLHTLRVNRFGVSPIAFLQTLKECAQLREVEVWERFGYDTYLEYLIELPGLQIRTADYYPNAKKTIFFSHLLSHLPNHLVGDIARYVSYINKS